MPPPVPADQLTVDVDRSTHPGAVVVTVSGELDVYTAPLLRDALLTLPLAELDVVVGDLSGLEFMDSSGLGVLVAAQKKLRAGGGGLRLVCAGGPVLRMLDLTGLSTALAVHPTLEAALAPID